MLVIEMRNALLPLDTQLAAAARARAGAAVLGGEHGREVELVVTVLLKTHIVTSDTCHYCCQLCAMFDLVTRFPHLVLPEHDVLVLDWADLAAGVGPDLRRAHVQGHDEQPQRHLGVEMMDVQYVHSVLYVE